MKSHESPARPVRVVALLAAGLLLVALAPLAAAEEQKPAQEKVVVQVRSAHGSPAAARAAQMAAELNRLLAGEEVEKSAVVVRALPSGGVVAALPARMLNLSMVRIGTQPANLCVDHPGEAAKALTAPVHTELEVK